MIRGYTPNPEWGREERLSQIEREAKTMRIALVAVSFVAVLGIIF